LGTRTPGAVLTATRALPWVSLGARLVLAAVFAAAGDRKLADTAASVRAVRAYQILPESAVHQVGQALPFVEVALAALLVAGLATRVAAAVAAALLVVFIAAVASAGLRGLHIDCGCFGGGGEVTQTHYLSEIARDLALLAVAALIIAIRRSALALVVAAVAGILLGNRSASPGTASATSIPGVTADGGYIVGSPGAPHTLVAYEDMQCPVCRRFDATNGTSTVGPLPQAALFDPTAFAAALRG